MSPSGCPVHRKFPPDKGVARGPCSRFSRSDDLSSGPVVEHLAGMSMNHVRYTDKGTSHE